MGLLGALQDILFILARRMDSLTKFLIHTLELKLRHFEVFPICLYREAMHLQCFTPTRYMSGHDHCIGAYFVFVINSAVTKISNHENECLPVCTCAQVLRGLGERGWLRSYPVGMAQMSLHDRPCCLVWLSSAKVGHAFGVLDSKARQGPSECSR